MRAALRGNQSVLLVDDVMTTGATADECADVRSPRARARSTSSPLRERCEPPPGAQTRIAASRATRPARPSHFSIEMLPLLPRGLALDVAAGTGRHSLALARAGMQRRRDGSFVALALATLRVDRAAARLAISPVVAEHDRAFRSAGTIRPGGQYQLS